MREIGFLRFFCKLSRFFNNFWRKTLSPSYTETRSLHIRSAEAGHLIETHVRPICRLEKDWAHSLARHALARVTRGRGLRGAAEPGQEGKGEGRGGAAIIERWRQRAQHDDARGRAVTRRGCAAAERTRRRPSASRLFISFTWLW